MSRFVLDTSVDLSWFFADEIGEYRQALKYINVRFDTLCLMPQ